MEEALPQQYTEKENNKSVLPSLYTSSYPDHIKSMKISEYNINYVS